MNGPFFAHWLFVGACFLAFVGAFVVGLQWFEQWQDERWKASDQRQHLKLSAFEKARLYNELKARSMRPAVKLGAIRQRNSNDAA